jgi:hypothetical protein
MPELVPTLTDLSGISRRDRQRQVFGNFYYHVCELLYILGPRAPVREGGTENRPRSDPGCTDQETAVIQHGFAELFIQFIQLLFAQAARVVTKRNNRSSVRVAYSLLLVSRNVGQYPGNARRCADDLRAHRP